MLLSRNLRPETKTSNVQCYSSSVPSSLISTTSTLTTPKLCSKSSLSRITGNNFHHLSKNAFSWQESHLENGGKLLGWSGGTRIWKYAWAGELSACNLSSLVAKKTQQEARVSVLWSSSVPVVGGFSRLQRDRSIFLEDIKSHMNFSTLSFVC